MSQMELERKSTHWTEDLFAPHFLYKTGDDSSCECDGHGGEQTVLVNDRATHCKCNGRLKSTLSGSCCMADGQNTNVYVRAFLRMVAERKAANHPTTVRFVNASTQTDLSRNSQEVSKIEYPKAFWCHSETGILKRWYENQWTNDVITKSEVKALEYQLKRLESDYCDIQAKYNKSIACSYDKDATADKLKRVNNSLKNEILTIMKQLERSENELKNQICKTNQQQAELNALSKKLGENSVTIGLQAEKLRRLEEELTMQFDMRSSALELKYEKKIKDLEVRIDCLTESLTEEQRLHAKSKQGLHNLIQHFSQSASIQPKT